MAVSNKTSIDATQGAIDKFTPSVDYEAEVTEETQTEAKEGMTDLAIGVILMLVVVAVGLLVLSEVYSSLDTTGPFSGSFDELETQVPVIIGLILVIPVVAVGAAAISMLRGRFQNDGGR